MQTLDQRSNEELLVRSNELKELKLENEGNDYALIIIAETQEKISHIIQDRQRIKEIEEDREVDELSWFNNIEWTI